MKICEHSWELVHTQLFDLGRNKAFHYRCSKCGKEAIRFSNSRFKLPKHGLTFRTYSRSEKEDM